MKTVGPDSGRALTAKLGPLPTDLGFGNGAKLGSKSPKVGSKGPKGPAMDSVKTPGGVAGSKLDLGAVFGNMTGNFVELPSGEEGEPRAKVRELETGTIADGLGAQWLDAPPPKLPLGYARPGVPTIEGNERAIWMDYLQKLAPGLKIVDGTAPWTAAELYQIALEAEKLPDHDLALLAKTTLRRDAAIADQHQTHSGEHDLGLTTFGADGSVTITLSPDTIGQIARTFAHELGHVAMADGRYSPDRIREFAKLSGFHDEMGNLPIGLDPTGKPEAFNHEFKPHVDNLISEYAGTSPQEDYAESYRTYIDDSLALVRTAPEKFLFINAESGKYDAAKTHVLMKAAGRDPMKVATDLVADSGLSQVALEVIL